MFYVKWMILITLLPIISMAQKSLAGKTGSTENPFTYIGGLGVMTEDYGLYFMRARFYEAESGRFLGKDPLEGSLMQPMSLHRYNYAAGNPIVWTDASGKAIPVVIAGAWGVVELYDFAASTINFGYYLGQGDLEGARSHLRSMITPAFVEIPISFVEGQINYNNHGEDYNIIEDELPTASTIIYEIGRIFFNSEQEYLESFSWEYNVPYILEKDVKYYYIELK
jgi:RHS repeat-associated protein